MRKGILLFILFLFTSVIYGQSTSASSAGHDYMWSRMFISSAHINVVGSVNVPTQDSVEANLVFSKTDTNTVVVGFLIPNDYSEGSDIYPYVIWTPTSADTGNVVWEIIASWTDMTGVVAYSDTLTLTSVVDSVASKLFVQQVESLDGSDKDAVSLVQLQVSRLGGASADTYDDTVGLRGVSLVYLSDKRSGSTGLIK